MPKKIFYFLFGILLLFSFTFEVQAAEKTVVVGTSGQTKPLDYFNEENELTGFEIDLLKEIDKQDENLTFEFQTTEFPSLFAGLDAKKFDLLINNLGESGDRREKYLFSHYPYVVTHNVIITSPDAKDNLKIEDLAGKNIAAVPASPQAQFLETWNVKHPNGKINIQYVDSDPSQIIRDVYSGKFDATIYATTYLADVENTFGIQLKAHPIENEDAIRPPGSYFIFRKEDEALRNEIDTILEELRQDGTLSNISLKYLNQDDTKIPESLKEKNDALEKERLKETTNDTSSKKNTGKIFAPGEILTTMKKILPKIPITLLMTGVSAIIGLILGFLISLAKIKKIPVLTPFLNVFVSFMRGTPQLVQLFLSFYGLPLIFQWLNQSLHTGINLNKIPALIYVFIAFGLNEAAYTSETFRSAILSVDQKEIEAAKSIGLTDSQTMRRIILPSAMIVALPNLGNSLISLLKGTSLAFTVTIVDIMGQTRIVAGSNLRFFEGYIAVALIYWLLCILIEQGIKALEKHFTKLGPTTPIKKEEEMC